MYSFLNAAMCSVFGGPLNVKIRQKCLEASQLISSLFIKHTPPSLYSSYIEQYIGIQKISIYNEKWYLQLCNLLFPVWHWSQNC